ncbi:MAG: hypothetical protein GY795_31760 [Desulfobacterales bacterium]|nr:hypothetical protein [Desulfobacterales bacterium]
MSIIKQVLVVVLACMILTGCDGNDDANDIYVAYKEADAKPVIWIGDFNNFDDAVALMLIAKDPHYRIELVVVEDSFNTVAHGANMVYNILEWLGNNDTQVIRGAYFALEEAAMGATADTAVSDDNSVPGQNDYQLPGSSDADGVWNLERRNAMGINLYGQYVPGPWRDNGSTLYGTDHLIPRAKQPHYHYNGNQGVAFNFVLAEALIAQKIDELDENVVILNTGKMTTLARFLAKATDMQLSRIEQVVMMGGGFQNYEPFTAAHNAACFGDKTLNLGGNIFSHPSFGCATDFSTHQEFNILLDPKSAMQTFDLLSEKHIPTMLIPTNATDSAKVHLATIASLQDKGATPEACYTARLLTSIREFEGGDNGGDFAMDGVIRLWDIVAALVLLEPDLITMTEESLYVDVDQLDEGLAESSTPYDPITFDPLVGKTTFTADDNGTPPKVILGIDTDMSRQSMINRLRDPMNAAFTDVVCTKLGTTTALSKPKIRVGHNETLLTKLQIETSQP